MSLISMQQSTALCTCTCISLARKDKAIAVVTAGGYFSRLEKTNRISLPYIHLSVFMTKLQKQSLKCAFFGKEMFRWIVWWKMSVILLPNGIMSLHKNGEVGDLLVSH